MAELLHSSSEPHPSTSSKGRAKHLQGPSGRITGSVPRTPWASLIVLFLFLSGAGNPLSAGADKKSKDSRVFTVKRNVETEKIDLSGVFEAKKTAEISVDTDQWQSLKVLKAAPHGARVKRGELLLTLDTEDIDKAIKNVRKQLKLSRLSLKTKEISLEKLSQTVPLDLKANKRAARIAKENLERYRKIERENTVRVADHSLKKAKEYLKYQLEELKQLEKMYKSDDLTEETEEIVLERQRNAVENAKFRLKQAKLERDETINVELPRKDVSIEEATRRAQLSAKEAEEKLPLSLKQQEYAFEKAKQAHSQLEEKLEELLADRSRMTVKSPIAGLVYYGKFDQGKWQGSQQIGAMLQPGETLKPDQVLMTVVKPVPMIIRTELAEKQIRYFQAGAKGTAEPVAYPGMELHTVVRDVDTIPKAPGMFGAACTVSLPSESDTLFPGMKCKLHFKFKKEKQPVRIPAAALLEEKAKKGRRFVRILNKKGKPVKKAVKTGQSKDQWVEILKGLKPGDKVLVSKAEAEEKAKEESKGKTKEKENGEGKK